MYDIKPFLKENRLSSKETASSSEEFQKLESELAKSAFVAFTQPYSSPALSKEDCEIIHDACLDDATKIIRYLDPQLKEHQSALERQVEAIEKIANEAKIQSSSSSEIATEAKKQSDASTQIADSAKIQADIALKKSKEADIKGWIAIIISLIALFIEIAVNYVEILNFIKLFI